MTESEWLTCTDPTPMWMCLPHRPSRRVASLYAVACVRATPDVDTQPLLLAATEAVEQVADTGEWGEVAALHHQADILCHEVELDSIAHYWALTSLRLTDDSIDYHAMHVPFFLSRALAGSPDAADLGQRYAGLLRDVVGKPVRHGRGKRMKNLRKPQPFPVLRESHLTSTVLALARGIYADQAFDRLPILADALQDAGCGDDDLLNHCRGDGPHVRGCWVVDLALGKG